MRKDPILDRRDKGLSRIAENRKKNWRGHFSDRRFKECYLSVYNNVVLVILCINCIDDSQLTVNCFSAKVEYLHVF